MKFITALTQSPRRTIVACAMLSLAALVCTLALDTFHFVGCSGTAQSCPATRTETPALEVDPLHWMTEAAAFDEISAARDELKLKPAVLAAVSPLSSSSSNNYNNGSPSQLLYNAAGDYNRGAATGAQLHVMLLSRGCNPTRFMTVNVDNPDGRHHNQLQDILNSIAFARRLGRTAVFSFFRGEDAQWHEASEFYDVSLIMQSTHHCVVSFADFKKLWHSLGDPSKTTALCIGQDIYRTPFRAVIPHCPLETTIPHGYVLQSAVQTTRGILSKLMYKPDIVSARFICLGAEHSYFLRPGMIPLARLFSRLRPSQAVAAEVQSFLRDAKLCPVPEFVQLWRDENENYASASECSRYFSLHLRNRENGCMKEVANAFAWNPELAPSLTAAQHNMVRAQCAISVDYVRDKLRARYNEPAHSKFFLSSDHQNKTLEDALVSNLGAVMTSGTGKFRHSTLLGLAVDYFSLIAGAGFSGNQLSSMSQNVCLTRLGVGLTCRGHVLAYSMHFLHPLSTA